MHYHFKIHTDKDKHTLWAECVELEGCVTHGKSKAELSQNAEESLNLYLDEPAESNVLFPLPKKHVKGRNIVQIPVEPKIAFSLLLRRYRLMNNMTQQEVAEKMGLKNIYSYQRLEYSKTANPALNTIVRVKRIFPDFQINEVFPCKIASVV